jgi:hypothetical protein
LGTKSCSNQQRHLLGAVEQDGHAVDAHEPGQVVADLGQPHLLLPLAHVGAHAAEVVLHRILPHVADPCGEARHGGESAERGRGPRPARHHRGERSTEAQAALPQAPEQATAAWRRVLQRGDALGDHQDRWQEAVGAEPAHQHADAADDAEVSKASELRDQQRRIGGGSRARRGQGRGPRLAVGLAQGPRNRQATTTRLEIARHEHDARVDPIARDDREQKAGGQVQVADQELGRRKGAQQADADGEQQREQRAEPQVEQEDDARDQRSSNQADVGQIPVDGLEGGNRGHEITRQAVANRWMERLQIERVDGRAQTADGLGSLAVVGHLDRRADQDHHGLAGLVLVVATGIALDVGLLDVEALLQAVRIEFGRLVALFVEQDACLAADLPLPARLHVVAQLLELLEPQVEAGPGLQVAPCIVHPALGRPDPGSADAHGGYDHGIGCLAQRAGVVPFQHHHHVGDAGGALLDAVELQHARPGLGQQMLEARQHVEPQSQEQRHHDQDHGRTEHQPGPTHLDLGQPEYGSRAPP